MRRFKIKDRRLIMYEDLTGMHVIPTRQELVEYATSIIEDAQPGNSALDQTFQALAEMGVLGWTETGKINCPAGRHPVEWKHHTINAAAPVQLPWERHYTKGCYCMQCGGGVPVYIT